MYGWPSELRGTLPSHVELLINQYPQVLLLLRTALDPFSAQPVFVLGIVPTHMQDFTLGIVEIHEVCLGPPLKPVKVPLDGIPSLQYVDCTTQLGAISKLAECALNPIVCVANKMLNSTAPNTNPQGTPLVTGLHLDIELLTATL